MSVRAWHRVPGVALLLITIACSLHCSERHGGSPAPTPSPPSPPAANILGKWVGTLESANFATRSVTLDIAQAGGCVDGSWTTTPAEWSGAISGTADATSFSAQVSFEDPSRPTGRCTAIGAITGDAGGATMTWTIAGFNAVSCTGALPQSVVLKLRRP